MDEVKQYYTARESNFQDLDNLVNQLIKKGWQPFGGPFVADSRGEFLACQAMVLCGEEEIASITPEALAALGSPDFSTPSAHDAFNKYVENLPGR